MSFFVVVFFAISFKMNEFREHTEKGDWHWMEKTCGVILPRVPFRKMVFFLSEFFEFGISCEINSDDNRGIPGRGLFLFGNNTPLDFWDP